MLLTAACATNTATPEPAHTPSAPTTPIEKALGCVLAPYSDSPVYSGPSADAAIEKLQTASGAEYTAKLFDKTKPQGQPIQTWMLFKNGKGTSVVTVTELGQLYTAVITSICV